MNPFAHSVWFTASQTASDNMQICRFRHQNMSDNVSKISWCFSHSTVLSKVIKSMQQCYASNFIIRDMHLTCLMHYKTFRWCPPRCDSGNLRETECSRFQQQISANRRRQKWQIPRISDFNKTITIRVWTRVATFSNSQSGAGSPYLSPPLSITSTSEVGPF